MVWWIMALDTISAHDVSAKILRRFRAEHNCPHQKLFFLRVVLLLHPLVHLVLRNTSRSILTHYLSHTIFDTPSFIQLGHTPSFTHNFVTPSLSHNFHTHYLSHTQLCHTPSLTHDLSHATLSHTIFHTPSLTHHLTHNFVTPSFTHHLSHTIFDTPSLTHHLSHHFATHHLSHAVTDHLSHTTLSHTIFGTHHLWHMIFHTPLCHTPSFTHNLWHTILHTPSFTTPSFTHNFVTNHFSSTSSFVFPSFPIPAAKFVDHYWKKLTCGVMRSVNFLLNKKQFGALRASQTRSWAPCSNWNTLRDHSMFFTGHGQCSC